MRTGPRLTPLFLGCFFATLVTVACATGSRRILLADGSYELKCEGALSTCLIQMEKTCKADGYEVLRGTETRERNGPIEVQTEIVRSTAIVRCRKSNAFFTFAPSPPPPAPLPTEAPPPLPDHAPLPALSAAPAPAAASGAPPAAAPSAAPAAPPTPPAP